LAVSLANDQGASITNILAAIFLLISVVFVWR